MASLDEVRHEGRRVAALVSKYAEWTRPHWLLESNHRQRATVTLRNCTVYILAEHYAYNYSEIAEAFRRTRGGVRLAHLRWENLITIDDSALEFTHEIIDRLAGGEQP